MRARHVCATPGCPTLVDRGYCPVHDPGSARNHRGVPRQARGHGAPYDRLARAMAGRPCELQIDAGCTGIASGADLIVPFSQGGEATEENTRPACHHCQNVQGAGLARAG